MILYQKQVQEDGMKFYFKLSACIVLLAAYVVCLIWLPFSPVTFLLGAAACNWPANLIHEAGHFFAYGILGLEWRRTVFSFFVLEKGRGIGIDKEKSPFAASCTCRYDPAVPFWRYLWALLAGGILCLAASAAVFVASLFAKGSLLAFLLCLGTVCALNALANLLIPFSADRVLIGQIKRERENK